jgi:hypothetical protein
MEQVDAELIEVQRVAGRLGGETAHERHLCIYQFVYLVF